VLNTEIESKEDLINIQKEAEKNFEEVKKSKVELENKIEDLQNKVNAIENLPMDYQIEKQEELKIVKNKIIDLLKQLALAKETIEVYSFEFNLG
jgi:predicted  nucleic acid-binding Zn-ribbon protein